jgi:hypothetical protein
MRRLLYSGLLAITGVIHNPAIKFDSVPASPASTTLPASPASPVAGYQNDPRFHALRRFFGKAGCPAKAYSHVFLEAADDYDLDWRLLPSISFVESTGGKLAKNNNLFGWNSGNARFSSPSAGIHAVGYTLANSRRYKDKKLDELLAIYNPNAEYAVKVKSVMLRIESFWPKRLKSAQHPNTVVQAAENHN